MYQKPKFLITQSLLSSWLYTYRIENGYQEFLDALNKKPKQPTQAMLDGNRFENVLNSVLDGAIIYSDHEWFQPIGELYLLLIGARQQVKLSRNIEVNGDTFCVYGVLDYLKAGHIYDTKYSKRYQVGKYLESPQTPFYFYLVPEAMDFTYLICDGEYIYKERYFPDEVEPIERLISNFMAFLDKHNLTETYKTLWKSKF